MGGEGLSPERKSWSAAGHVGRLVGGCFGLVFVVGPMHLRLIVETGRKHQIRVQAAHAGLPLLGDRTYHPGYRRENPAETPIDFPRQALHAEVLSLEHPDQPGTRMSWTAELPKDLRQLESALRSHRRLFIK